MLAMSRGHMKGLPELPIWFNMSIIACSWNRTGSRTPALLATRTIVPLGKPSSKHTAETLAPSFLVAHIRANASRNVRFRRDSLEFPSAMGRSGVTSFVVGSLRTGSSWERRTETSTKRLRRFPVIGRSVMFRKCDRNASAHRVQACCCSLSCSQSIANGISYL